MTEPRAPSVGELKEGPGCGWLPALILICVTSAWALIWGGCAFDGWGWARPEGWDLALILTLAFAPLILVLCLLFGLRGRRGPPPSRAPEE